MKAFLWMTGSLASFGLMAIAGRELAGAISTSQILFCSGLIACLFLKESLTLRKVAAILLGTLGVVLMLNLGSAQLSVASLYVVAAAIFYSRAYVATKSLSATEDPLTILFYMCLLQLPVGVLVYHETFNPLLVVGAGLMLMGNLLNLYTPATRTRA